MLKSKSLNWILVIIWAGIIWLLSSIPDLKTDIPQDLLLRKIAHIVEFAILALLLNRALGLHIAKTKARLVLFLATTLTLGYAILDEVHQSFVTSRHGSFFDVLIDLTGILAAIGFITFFKYRSRIPE